MENDDKDTGSEFGKGFVYCLMLFTMHLRGSLYLKLADLYFISNKTPEERELMMSDNPPPSLNYGKDMEYSYLWWRKILPIYGNDFNRAFSREIEVWMNGASDHMYEFTVPHQYIDTELGRKAMELQELTLSIGHGFTGNIWTWDHVEQINNLVRDITFLLDKELGVENIRGTYE